LNQRGEWTRLILAIATLSIFACTSSGAAVHEGTGRALTEAETLFHREPRWLGADAALSVPLGSGRTLWLFGDTFIATSNAHVRSESRMVRNTVAIQTGDDPRTASITFHWRQNGDGLPESFFREQGRRWYWPGHGIRLAEGPLVVFLYAMVKTHGKGLGFANAGYALAVIDHPDRPAETWTARNIEAAPNAFDAVPATAVVREGDYVVALAIRQNGVHAGALVRYPVASLMRGDVTRAEWWAGDASGWVPASSLGKRGPSFVFDDAGSECSLHWEPRTRSFVHVASYGFGASSIAVRTAPALTGPWTSPIVVYRPPESDGPKPFVYAARAHPELAGPDAADLVVTYATNSFEFTDLLSKQGERFLYWPRVVAVRLGK
jgi:hypothetical protein